jgi:hypothetical protein
LTSWDSLPSKRSFSAGPGFSSLKRTFGAKQRGEDRDADRDGERHLGDADHRRRDSNFSNGSCNNSLQGSFNGSLSNSFNGSCNDMERQNSKSR